MSEKMEEKFVTTSGLKRFAEKIHEDNNPHNIKPEDIGAVSKIENTTTREMAYVVDADNNTYLKQIRPAAATNSIVARDKTGRFNVLTPEDPDNAVNKAYVDDQINDTFKTTTNTWLNAWLVPAVAPASSKKIYLTASDGWGPDTLMIRDENGTTKSRDPVNILDVTNKQYVDNGLNAKLDKVDNASEYSEVYIAAANNDNRKTIPLRSHHVANTVVIRDNTGSFNVPTPTLAENPVPKQYVDNGFVKRYIYSDNKHMAYGVGPNDTVVMFNVNTEEIKHSLIFRDADGRAKVNDPVNPLDISNKQYVDNQINALSGEHELDVATTLGKLEEFNNYIFEHGEVVDGFRADINKNKEDIAKKLDKITFISQDGSPSTSDTKYAYILKENGECSVVALMPEAIRNTIVYRRDDGYFFVANPTAGSHPANKQYVDDAISGIDLTEYPKLDEYGNLPMNGGDIKSATAVYAHNVIIQDNAIGYNGQNVTFMDNTNGNRVGIDVADVLIDGSSVDDRFLKTDGSTPMTGNLDMGEYDITNMYYGRSIRSGAMGFEFMEDDYYADVEANSFSAPNIVAYGNKPKIQLLDKIFVTGENGYLNNIDDKTLRVTAISHDEVTFSANKLNATNALQIGNIVLEENDFGLLKNTTYATDGAVLNNISELKSDFGNSICFSNTTSASEYVMFVNNNTADGKMGIDCGTITATDVTTKSVTMSNIALITSDSGYVTSADLMNNEVAIVNDIDDIYADVVVRKIRLQDTSENKAEITLGNTTITEDQLKALLALITPATTE